MTSNQLKDFAAYLLLPSEIECRTVASRLTGPPEQRKARPPVAALLEEEASTKRFLECLKEFLRQSAGRENLTVNDVKPGDIISPAKETVTVEMLCHNIDPPGGGNNKNDQRRTNERDGLQTIRPGDACWHVSGRLRSR